MPTRVLIVDDEPNIVVSLEFLIASEGWESAVATTGEEAIASAERFDPDLVLLDVMLPDRDGFDVCRELRASGSRARIVLLTARGRDAERVKGLDLGADLYVTKPFSTRELMALLRECLAPPAADSDG